MFGFLIQGILTALLLYVSYRYWIFFQVRKKLSWLPASPRLPFLGSALEFGKDTTEFVENMIRLSNNPAKSFYFEMGLDQYGILTKSHDLMEFLLGSNKLAILSKSTDYQIFEPWLGTGLLTSPGTKWKKRRRIITPAFHFSILEQFVEVFEANGKILIQKLRESAVDKDSVNIYTYATNCTLDIISESAMGVSVKSQEGNNGDYVTSVQDMCRIILTRAFSPITRNDYIFKLTPRYKDYQRHLKVLHNFTNNVIQNRINELNKQTLQVTPDEDGKKRKLAFLDLLLNATIDGKPLSKEDIREEVDTFMFEGHDTTSFAISMTLYLLANHPEIQTLARNEQKELFGTDKDRQVTLQDLNDMKYLDLVIKESLRLYPSVPGIGRQVTEDIDYHGNVIPKGAIVNLLIYGINRDPDYHENPDEFIPDRHLSSNGKFYSNIPFSAGPRNCIGQKFATLEMKSTISKVIRNFELFPTNPVHKPILAMEAVFTPTNGVNIRLKNHQWA